MRLAASLFGVAVAVGYVPPEAHAEGNRPGLAFDHLGGEIATGAFAAATPSFYFLPQQKGTWGPFEARPFEPISGSVSDLTAASAGSAIQLGLGFLFETGYLAVAGLESPASNSLYAVMVETESLLLATGVDALIKRLVGRCRPRAYDPRTSACREYDAFPSGHTASIAAFAGARVARTALTPWNEAAPIRVSGLVVAEACTVVTAILRVTSGSHSWEDVLVGALVGHAAGIGLELIHQPARFGDGKDGAPATIAEPTDVAFSARPPQGPYVSWAGSF